MSRTKETVRKEYSRDPTGCQPEVHRAVDAWLNVVHGVLAPPTCVLCGSAGSAPSFDLCGPCEFELPVNAPACAVCAQPLTGDPSLVLVCGRCQQRPPRFHASFCPYKYAYPVDHLVRGLKYHNALAQGRVLGQLLARQLEGRQPRDLPDCLVPVPLGERRFRLRGYNQAIELALPIQKRLGVPLRPDLVARTRETAEQTTLDRSARRRNLRGAFTLSGRLRMRRIAIVDDVITTASTVNELARVLRRAGAKHVEVWAVARASWM